MTDTGNDAAPTIGDQDGGGLYVGEVDPNRAVLRALADASTAESGQKELAKCFRLLQAMREAVPQNEAAVQPQLRDLLQQLEENLEETRQRVDDTRERAVERMNRVFDEEVLEPGVRTVVHTTELVKGRAGGLHDDDEEDDEDDFRLPGQWMEGDSLAPPCQTEFGVLSEILDLASVGPNDVVMDLGCGDGRVCTAAADRCGARGIGVEIEPDLVARFRERVSQKGLKGRVSVVQDDLSTVDVSQATVMYLFLLPEAIRALQDTLRECLERGVRLVCNTWGLPPTVAKPTEVRNVGYLKNTRLMLYDGAKSLVVIGGGGGGGSL